MEFNSIEKINAIFGYQWKSNMETDRGHCN